MNLALWAGLLALIDLAVVWYYRVSRAKAGRSNPPPTRTPLGPNHCFDGKISFVIPAWNEEKVIADCLRTVISSSTGAWECIVVAGGSDNTCAIVKDMVSREPRIQMLEQRPDGKNAALNDGVVASTGEVVVFLDADTRIRIDYVPNLRRIVYQKNMMLIPDYRPITASPTSMLFMVDKIHAYEIHGHREIFGGASIVISREALRLLGPMPEELAAAVDWDLGKKARAHGITAHFSNLLSVETEIPSTFHDLVVQNLRWKRALLAWILRQKTDTTDKTTRSALIPYLVAAAIGSFTLLSTVGTTVTASSLAALEVAIVASIWIAARNSSSVAEVAAFKGERKWLSLIPYRLLTNLLDIYVTLYSMITFRKVTKYFKGARTLRKDQEVLN